MNFKVICGSNDLQTEHTVPQTTCEAGQGPKPLGLLTDSALKPPAPTLANGAPLSERIRLGSLVFRTSSIPFGSGHPEPKRV